MSAYEVKIVEVASRCTIVADGLDAEGDLGGNCSRFIRYSSFAYGPN
jgi:hypothetical protein